MKKYLANFIQETTATTGTGQLTLAGVVNRVRFRDRHVNGERVYYSIENGNNLELGLGTYVATDGLARTTILETLVAGVWTSGGSPLTLVGSSVVRAVLPEQLLTAFNKVEYTPISASGPVEVGKVYGVGANSLTLTLPATATAGDRIGFLSADVAISGTVIDVNGHRIQDVVGNMNVNLTNFAFTLLYRSASYGWKVLPA